MKSFKEECANEELAADAAAKPGPTGQDLLDTVVELTGLPDELIRDELGRILVKGLDCGDAEQALDVQSLTLEQLRAAMISYLESMNSELEESDVMDEAPSSSVSEVAMTIAGEEVSEGPSLDLDSSRQSLRVLTH